MYPEGTLVQVVENTNNHWFEVGEFVIVTEASKYSFRGVGASGDERVTSNGTPRYRIGGGPQVMWREVILVADSQQFLEQLLKECLE
jgi:hypothetical protein